MTGPDPRYELVYQEARQALAAQDQRLEGMRNRASAILAAASISNAVLGSPALDENGINVWAWLAFSCLVAITACVIAIMWPTKGWGFRMGVSNLVSGYVEAEPSADIDEMRRDLALYLEKAYERNDGRMAKRYRLLRASAVLLAVGVVVWFGDLAWG
jgi:hypothetical protein